MKVALIFAVACLAGTLCTGHAAAQSPSTQPAPAATATTKPAPTATAVPTKLDRAATIRQALNKLTEEARELDNLKTVKTQPVFTRPHPMLAKWGPEYASEVLNIMLQPHTSDEYRDTYIRWHLMWVAKQIPRDERRSSGPRLVSLIKMLPGPLNVKPKPEGTYEPLDIYEKWRAMIGGVPSANAVVGYPPFTRVVGPPESFKYLGPGAAASYQKAIEDYQKRTAEAEKLYGGKFKYVRDEGGIAFNRRLYAMHNIARHYRGELIYAMIRSGDPETGKLVITQMCDMAKKQNGIAFDLLAYVYLAAFDGGLNAYDQATLDEMAKILNAGARSTEGYVSYGGQTRNFADASFHLIELLKDGGGFIEAERVAGK